MQAGDVRGRAYAAWSEAFMADPEVSGSGSAPPSTSRSLLERIRVADAAAWDRLVQLYAPLVYYWCRRWDLQAQDTADVFQEVFLSVAQHVAGFRKERPGDTFRGWLRVITRNKILDQLRRRGKEACAEGGTDAQIRMADLPAPMKPEDESVAEDQAARSLFLRGLTFIRGEFEPRTWQAFWETAVEGRAAADVAHQLAMTPGAVRVAKSRVLQRLRSELGDLMDD
jgi:RNA polymerase sigma-70 factor (ECF subfamily)